MQENEPEIKDKGGRPPKTLSLEEWDNAERMASVMCTGEEIAHCFRMHYETFVRQIKSIGYKGFADWYKEHSSMGKMSLRRKQFDLAEKNAAMAIFLGKNYLGQSDKFENHVQAQIVQVNYTDDQVSQAIEAAKKFKEENE